MSFKVSKVAAACIKCGKPVNKGDRIWWTIESRGLEHAECHGPEPEKFTSKPRVLSDSERCTEEKVLYGETMRCEHPKGHRQGHSYHFTVEMGRRFWKAFHSCKDDTVKLSQLMGEK